MWWFVLGLLETKTCFCSNICNKSRHWFQLMGMHAFCGSDLSIVNTLGLSINHEHVVVFWLVLFCVAHTPSSWNKKLSRSLSSKFAVVYFMLMFYSPYCLIAFSCTVFAVRSMCVCVFTRVSLPLLTEDSSLSSQFALCVTEMYRFSLDMKCF